MDGTRIEWANGPEGGNQSPDPLAEVEEGDNDAASIEGGDEDAENVHEHGVPGAGDDYSEEVYAELEESAGTVSFYEICRRLESCRTRRRDDRIEFLFDREMVNKIKGNRKDRKISLFPIIRLLCSEHDYRRGKLLLKGARICEIYIKVLQLSRQDAQRLREYRDPKKNDSGGGSVDICETLKEILRPRVSDKPSGLSVSDVHTILDKLAAPRDGKRFKNIEELTDIFRMDVIERMSCLEQVWLARVIIQETKRSGITSDAIIKFLGQNAAKSFSMIKYLRRVCADQAFGMTEASSGYRLGYPPQPMLANKGASIQQVEAAMRHKPFVMERKLDGHRLQIHRMRTTKEGKGEYYYSTRGTLQGGEKVASLDKHKQEKYASIEPYLDKCITVEKCILDGEMMGWDPVTESFTKFENICGVHLRTGKSVDADHFAFIAFDIIYIEGEGTKEAFEKAGMEPCKAQELKDRPLDERRRLLRAAVNVEDKRVEFVEDEEVHSQETVTRIEQLKTFWDRAVDENWEGLVVKGLHTPYVSDSRSHWYKIKPDYVNEVEPMDVVILGGYFRQGSLWSGSVSRFLVGIAIDDPTCLDNEEGQWPSRRYYAFAKVASGLNTQERQRLDEKLSPHWIVAPADGSVPPWLSGWHPTKDDRPARFIEPQKSVILECVASELVTSKSFNVGYTMRGPRMKSVRYDKPIRDALDYTGFLAVRENFRRSSEKAAQPIGKRGGRDLVPRKKGLRLAEGFQTWRPEVGEDGVFKVQSSALQGTRLVVLPSAYYETSMEGAAELFMSDVKSKDVTSPTGRGSKSHVPDANGRKRSDQSEDDKWRGATQPSTQGLRVKAHGEVRVDQNHVISLATKHGAECLPQVPNDKDPRLEDDDDSDDEEGARGRKRKRGRRGGCSFLIVAPSPRCPKAVNIIKSHEKLYGGLLYDIVSLDWLIDCVKAGRSLLPRPHHLYEKTRATKKRLERTYDEHHDSWSRPVTVEGLAKLLREMKAVEGPPQQWRDLADTELVDDEESAAMESQAALFYGRSTVFYVDCFETLGPASDQRRPLLTSMLGTVRARLRLQGARVSDVLDRSVTMVVVDEEDMARFGAIVDKEKQVATQRGRGDTIKVWKVVNRRWVDRCLSEKYMTPPDDGEMVHLPSLLRAAKGPSTLNVAEVE